MGLVRLLLALSVVLTHTDAAYTLAGGRLAVQLFYMISGFLISYVLHRRRTYDNPVRFYAARALRIYPPYLVVALFVFGLFIFEKARLQLFSEFPLGLKLFVGVVNITLLGQDWANFIQSPPGMLPLHKFMLVPQAWSLGVELSFYILAPFIIRRRALLIAILAVSLIARAVAAKAGFSADPWSYRFFPFEIALFIAGALSQQMVLPWAERLAVHWRAPATVASLFVAGAGMAMPFGEPTDTLFQCLWFMFALPMLFLFQRDHPWDARLGDLSYPIYLAHWAVAQVALEIAGKFGLTKPPAFTLIVVTGALAAAWMLETFVGKPVERLRGRLKVGETTGAAG